MGSLFSSLANAAESFRTIQRAIEFTGNNVANAKTPGYAKNRVELVAQRFDIYGGSGGGVRVGPLVSSRQENLETAVRDRQTSTGRYSQQAESISQVEPVFDISENSGIAGALDQLFQGFSLWSVNPNDRPARADVIARANSVASAFQYTATSLDKASSEADRQLNTVVTSINRLGSLVHDYNLQVRQDGRAAQDPGLDSQIHQTLEDLSEYVDFGVLKSDKDGSLTVNLGGQNPITIGGEFRPIQLDTSSASVRVLDQTGNDITSQIQGGRLRGALDVRNNLIPSLQSQVNQLASSMADAINSTLRNGIDVNKASPTTDLFQYDPNFPARTLSVTNIQPDELAAADPSAPGGNANALALANLGSSKQISDYSFSQFYGYIASQVGTALSGAKNAQKGQQLLLTQAKSLRSEASDVSLDEEASSLIAYQRAYQANAELVNILNSLTETTIGILR